MGSPGLSGSTPGGRPELVLAFDFGTQRIGVAAGESLTRTARALTTLAGRHGPPWAEIERLVEQLGPDRIVVGLPYNMDGSETTLTPRARAFARQLVARLGLPVSLVDERLSSLEAEEGLRQARRAGIRRRRVRREDVDSAAASVILQRWFEEGGIEVPGRGDNG